MGGALVVLAAIFGGFWAVNQMIDGNTAVGVVVVVVCLVVAWLAHWQTAESSGMTGRMA